MVDGRLGAPVFTIETYQNHESWAFDGTSGELHDLAQAIVNVILDS